MAHQRAPTLMAGLVAGSQGAVRVWGPQRRLLRWSVAIWIAVSVCYLYLTLEHLHCGDFGALFGNVVWLGWCLIMLHISVSALRRPAYLTTDDAGMAITLENGPAIALRWDEIYRVKCPSSFNSTLEIEQSSYGKPLTLFLTGYSKAHRSELAQLICERAALDPSRFDRNLLLRKVSPPLTGSRPR